MIVHYKQRYFFHHSFDCVSEVSHLDSLALCFTPRSSELWMHLHLVHHRSRWAPMLGRKAAVQALENQPFGEVKQGLCFPVNWGVMINKVRIVLSAYLPQQCFRDCPIGFWHGSILLGIKRHGIHWIIGSIVKAGPKNFHEMVSRWVEGIIWNQLLKFPKISGAQITILYPWKIYSRIAELPMADEAWRCVSCIHFCETTSRWKWVWVKPLVKIPWWKMVKSKKVDKWMFILQTMVLWCFDSSPTFIGRSISIAHV